MGQKVLGFLLTILKKWSILTKYHECDTLNICKMYIKLFALGGIIWDVYKTKLQLSQGGIQALEPRQHFCLPKSTL